MATICIDGDRVVVDGSWQVPYTSVSTYDHHLPGDMADTSIFNNDLYNPFRRRHVRIDFPNGWVMSLTWGTGSYSDNATFIFHENFDLDTDRQRKFTETPSRVEMWCWNPYTNQHLTEDPVGYTPVETVVALFVEMHGWDPIPRPDYFAAAKEIVDAGFKGEVDG